VLSTAHNHSTPLACPRATSLGCGVCVFGSRFATSLAPTLVRLLRRKDFVTEVIQTQMRLKIGKQHLGAFKITTRVLKRCGN
jgi:hypothetical protein